MDLTSCTEMLETVRLSSVAFGMAIVMVAWVISDRIKAAKAKPSIEDNKP